MSSISKQALKVENNTSFPDNNTGYITPSLLRAFNVDMIDSTVNQASYSVDIAAIQSEITALEAFTASQQPSFAALNSFTASASSSIGAINAFTQSAGAELDSLSAWTGSWNAWTSSINEIRDDGVLQGYSTRFFFNGLVSASIVQNVGGPIANVTIQSDGTKLDTASFNSYTASTAATQSVFSASVATSISQSSATFSAFSSSQNNFNQSATASLVQLLNFSSSLDAGFVSEAEFALYTSSTNAFTASAKQSITSLSGLTGSYATTGSNGFFGNQNVNGNILVSGSVSLLNEGGNGWSFSSKALFLTNSVQTGITVESPIHFYKQTKGDMYITVNANDPGSSGSMNLQVYNNQNLNISSSATIVRGKFNNFTPLASNESQIDFVKLPTFTGANGTTYPYANFSLADYGSAGIDQTFVIEYANDSFEKYSALYVGPSRTQFIVGTGAGYDYDVIELLDNDNNTTTAKVKADSVILQGAIQSTGSVRGNVSALSINSNTASINLSLGNFFTLTLVSGSTTHLTATNIRPGQTVNVLVTQPSIGTGSVSYSNTIFDFPAGANYVPTPITGSKDIISFISFDSSILYATSINNLA